MRRRRLSTAERAVIVLALIGALGLGAGFALAHAGLPKPRLTRHPRRFTRAGTASFAFRDSPAAKSFRCSLDRGPLVACASGKAYKRLRAGRHIFAVVARGASGATSPRVSYRWTIDRRPPSISFGFPLSGGYYGAAPWAAGCSGASGVCGIATDPSGVRSVAVAIRQNATGRYWDGVRFSARAVSFRQARLSRTPAGVRWRYPVSLPAPDGSYTLQLTAVDRLGNGAAAAPRRPRLCRARHPRRCARLRRAVSVPRTLARATFTVGTIAPPAPLIESAPPSQTAQTSARFVLSDSAAGVTFSCSLDGGPWRTCANPATYSGLAGGGHSFAARAIDAAGNPSAVKSFAWQVIPSAGGVPFTIAGDAPGLLYPGGPARPIALTLANGSDAPIYVTGLTVGVLSGSLPAGCSGNGFALSQSDASPATPVQVPPHGSVSLPAQGVSAPSLQMLDLPGDQSACANAVLRLTYAGSAHS
jgi:hypothetical protein